MMRYIVFFIGVFLLAAGVGYLYWPKTVRRINKWFRHVVFSDDRVKLDRKKIGTSCVILSIILLCIAINISRMPDRKGYFFKETMRFRMYQGYRNYYLGEYGKAEKQADFILSREPNNVRALELLGLVYYKQHAYLKAQPYLKKILKINPDNTRIKKIMEVIEDALRDRHKR